MTGATDRFPIGTAVTVSINPTTPDMQVVDLGDVDLSEGTRRLASLTFGPVSVLGSSDGLDALDRLAEMVAEARALLTRPVVVS